MCIDLNSAPPFLDARSMEQLPLALKSKRNLVIIRPWHDCNGHFDAVGSFYQEFARIYNIAVVVLSNPLQLGEAFELGWRELDEPAEYDALIGGHGCEKKDGVVFGLGEEGVFRRKHINPLDFEKITTVYLQVCDSFEFGKLMARMTGKPVWAADGTIWRGEIAVYPYARICQLVCFNDNQNIYRYVFPNGLVVRTGLLKNEVTRDMLNRVQSSRKMGRVDRFAVEFLTRYFWFRKERHLNIDDIYGYISHSAWCEYVYAAYLWDLASKNPHCEMGKKALTHLKRSADRGEYGAQKDMGEILLSQGNPKGALVYLNQARKRSPEVECQFFYAQGCCLLKRDKPAAAEWFYQCIERYKQVKTKSFLPDAVKNLYRLVSKGVSQASFLSIFLLGMGLLKIEDMPKNFFLQRFRSIDHEEEPLARFALLEFYCANKDFDEETRKKEAIGLLKKLKDDDKMLYWLRNILNLPLALELIDVCYEKGWCGALIEPNRPIPI